MDNNLKIIHEIYKNFCKEFPQKKIKIRKIKVKRKGSYIFKIYVGELKRYSVYYAKYYPQLKNIRYLSGLNNYSFNSNEYKIAKPSFVFNDIKTIAYKKINGIRFSYFIPLIISYNYYIYYRKINEIIKKIARCLAYFQLNSNPRIYKLIDIEYTLLATKQIQNLSRIDKSKINYILKNDYKKIGKMPLLFQHSDFVPKNIIISNNSIGLVDVDYFRFDNKLLDIHSFISNLEFRTISPVYSKKVIKNIKRELLNEYKKYYPVPLTKEILLYTKLIFLVSYLFEKERLIKTKSNYNKIKTKILINQITKNILETVSCIQQ
jgi:thiamine kinase-like enzyme